MMAMTPQEKKTLEDIERAFLESIEPRFSPVLLKPSMMPTTKIQDLKTASRRSGWFSGMKERLVMKFVCCAPPQSLLDDDEIQEILTAMEEPVVKASALPPRKDSLMRRSSASVMPMARASVVVREEPTTDVSPLTDITKTLDEDRVVVSEPSTELAIANITSPVSSPRLRIKLSTIQLVVMALLALQNRVHTRQTERVALSIQLRWRRRQQFAISTPTPAPVPASVPVPAPESAPVSPVPTPIDSPVTCSEPDNEPEMASPVPTTPIASPKRPRRIRKHRGRKKTKTDIPAEETAQAVDSLTQLALTRKRLRSIDLESSTPVVVDVERNVHVLFGEEEIDDEDDEELKLPPLSPFRLFAIQATFPMQRCASVPPPPTAFRPQPKKSKFLIEAQAALTLQRVWRAYKLRVEREVQRRLKQYEAEKHSVMPTIRSKMAELRQRLEEMQERSLECSPTIVDDDLDWL